jgi:hypothetical protein
MSLLRLLLVPVLALTAQPGAAADDKKDKDKPAEPPKELSFAPHDSKTRGAVEVRTLTEKTGQWFRVAKGGKDATPGVPPLLNTALELDPGEYAVIVNRTERKVTVEAGKKAVLWTGELVVEGEKGRGDYYAPFQGKEKKLTSAEPLVNNPTSLFAGTYSVKFWGKVTKDLGDAEVKPGQQTVLKP